MSEEKGNAEMNEKCCSDRSEKKSGCCSGLSGCRCFKLAIAVLLVIVGFWMGYVSGRCGLGMKCGQKGQVRPCPVANNAAVTPP